MSKPIAISGGRGVNRLEDPTNLDANELVWAKNLFPHKPGALGTRKAFTYLKNFLALSYDPLPGGLNAKLALNSVPLGLDVGAVTAWQAFALSTIPGAEYVAVLSYAGNNNYPFFNTVAGDYLVVTGPQATKGFGIVAQFNYCTVPLVRRGNTQYTIVNVGNRTLVFDGTSSGYVISRRSDSDASRVYIGNYDAAAPQLPSDIVIQSMVFIGAQDVPLTPLYCTVAGNRVVWGAPDADHPSMIFWGDPIDQISPDSWRTVGTSVITTRGFVIGTSAEGGLTALFSAANSPEGYPQAQSVLVFKQNSMFQVLGEPGYSTDSTSAGIKGSLNISRVNVRVGCDCPNTITSTPAGIIWVGADDVWLFTSNNNPERVGTKIRPLLLEQPIATRYKMHAAYHDGIYKLALFEPGQGPGLNSACHHQWWLDLRGNEAPTVDTGAWFGPMVPQAAWSVDYGSYALVTEVRPNYDPVLLCPQMFSITTGGSLFASSPPSLQLVVCTNEGFAPYDSVLPTEEYKPWTANTLVLQGARISPQDFGGRTFICSSSGTTAGTEPNWGLVNGSTYTIDDGSMTWSAAVMPPSTGQVPWSYLPASLQNGYIFFDLISKEFTEPDPRLMKLLDGMDLVWRSNVPPCITVSLSPDMQSADNFPVSTPPQASTFNVFAHGMQLGNKLSMQLNPQWQTAFLPPLPDRRSRAYSYQIQMTQTRKLIVPWQSRYLTVMNSAISKTLWLTIDMTNFVLAAQNSNLDPRGYVGNDLDFDVTHQANAIGSVAGSAIGGIAFALQTFLGVAVTAATPTSIPVPADPAGVNLFDSAYLSRPNFTMGSYPFGGICILYDVDAQGWSINSLPVGVRENLLASNRFWLNLLGFTFATTLSSGGGDFFPTQIASVPAAWPAIIDMKTFGPRVRAFNRSPT